MQPYSRSHQRLSAILALTLLALSTTTLAHEVSASSVCVVIDGERLEIWQTTPRLTALAIGTAANPIRTDAGGSARTDGDALAAIARGWQVGTAAQLCQLRRQAHRRSHHETQLQLRYLYECAGSGAPIQLRLDWLSDTPSDHFVLFEVQRGVERQTRILQRNDRLVTLPQSS